MLSRNILIASVVVLMATTMSAAPVEEKEPEEIEIEVEDGEEELSEEEEDEDDSKSQENNMGIGAQQATTESKGLGLKLNGNDSIQVVIGSSSSTSISEGSRASDGADGGRDPHASPSDSNHHDASSFGQPGSSLDSSIAGPPLDSNPAGAGAQDSSVSNAQASGTMVLHSETITHGSTGQAEGGSPLIAILGPQPQPAGGNSQTFDAAASQTEAPTSETETDSPEYDTSELPDSNGNGQKLLNGGVLDNGHADIPFVHDVIIEGTTHADSTGATDPSGASSHLDYTGIIDQSSHDFLIGLMGGVVDPFGPDVHIDISALGSDPGQSMSSSSSLGPNIPQGPTDYSDPDQPNVSSGSDGSHNSTVHHAGQADTTGNGNDRQSHVADPHRGDHPVTDMPHDVTGEHGAVTHHDVAGVTNRIDVHRHNDVHTVGPRTFTTGAAEDHVTSSHIQIDITALGTNVYSSSVPGTAGLNDVGVTRGLINSTESTLEFGHDSTVTGDPRRALSQTEAIGTVTADPQGSTLQSSSPSGVTEQKQHAVSATEQYNPSGQGPEGAENVELEDTC